MYTYRLCFLPYSFQKMATADSLEVDNIFKRAVAHISSSKASVKDDAKLQVCMYIQHIAARAPAPVRIALATSDSI